MLVVETIESLSIIIERIMHLHHIKCTQFKILFVKYFDP